MDDYKAIKVLSISKDEDMRQVRELELEGWRVMSIQHDNHFTIIMNRMRLPTLAPSPI